MTILNILQYPDPRLKRVSIQVDPLKIKEAAIQQAVNDMFETHYHSTDCAALAATQLDLEPPWRITVIDFSENHDQPLCLINPEIVEMEGEQYEEEGCMSVYPNVLREKVKRAMRIRVKYYDREGQACDLEADGFMAKCIQHEVDHLDGKIYLDRLSGLKRERLLGKLKKIK